MSEIAEPRSTESSTTSYTRPYQKLYYELYHKIYLRLGCLKLSEDLNFKKAARILVSSRKI
ncbi:MAG: hypothetical protein LBE31_07525 [Deltaproteobacteria bacterium]|jgi:hypothetical protein|nr:hypothetical protein [Deltaproteobacteria bacterium]